MSFLNPISPIQVLGQSSVSRESFYGTTFSNNIVGGYMQVNSLSDLIYTIPSATYGLIEYSANTIPIQFLKGDGTSWSPDVLTLNSDNLSSGRRKIGMLVYVREQEQLYQYTNDNFLTLWNAATAATGTVVISDFGTTVNNSTAAGQNFINSWTASTIDGYNGVVRSNAVWKKYYGNTISVTGASFNSGTGTLTLTNITGGTQTLSGFGSGGGGGAGITGGTFNQSTLDLDLTSSAGTVTINGVTGLYISGGTYSASTSTILLYNSTGGTINITGITASGGGGVTTTGGTYTAGTATFTNSTGGTFSVTGFSKYFVTGSTPSGVTLNNGDRWFDTNTGIEVVWITDTDGSQWIQPTQGGGSSIGDYLPLSGGTVSGNTYFTSGLTANTLNVTGNTILVNTSGTSFYTNYIDFNNTLSPLPSDVEGRMYWDEDNGTVSLGMHGGQVVQQIGLEQYYYIKNQSGATIQNGRVVRADGTLGSSGRILGKYMIANGTIPAKYTLGIATEDIIDGDDGYVTEFGLVRGIDTTGSLYGETWVDGDILWVSPTIEGGLTKFEPQSPYLKIEIAIVVRAYSNGSLFVRPNRYPYMYDIQQVNYSAGTESNYDILQWSGSSWNKTNTPFFNGLTATTISATTYQNLPTDVRVTGATYSNNNFTFTNNTGGTFSVLFNTVTGLTVNGNLTVTGNTVLNRLTATTITATTYLNLPQSVTGTGTSDYVTKWDGVGLGLVDSQIYDDGSFIGIGTTSSTYSEKLSIQSGNKGIVIDSSYIIQTSNNSLAFATGSDYSVWGGSGEIAIGTRSPLINSTGSGNIGIGDKALAGNTTGTNNIAIGGTAALLYNTDGTDNIAIGFNSSNQNVSGTNNISLGTDSLFNNIGNRNVAIGVGAGYTNGNRDRNVYIGYAAGYSNNGSSNIFIGDSAGNSETTASNRLIIGDTIYGDLNSKLIGINQANPVTTLDVNGTTNISGGLTASTVSATTETISGTKGSVITNGNTSTAFLTISGSNTVGGASYVDFLRVTNNSVGATNATKTIRVNNTGGMEFLNSAYTALTLTIGDNGALFVGGGNAATTSSTDGITNYLNFNNNNSQIYDDGNLHIHSRAANQAMWVNTNNGAMYLLTQSPLSGGAIGTGIGIATTTLIGYVTINTGKTYTTSAAYGYLTTAGAGTYPGGSQTVSISLYATDRVWAQEFDAFSDERMKDIQGTVELDDAIKLVNDLKPIKYTWKEGEDKGLKVGYSAQQVSKAGFDHLIGVLPKEGLEETIDEDGFVSPKDTQFSMNYEQVTPYHGVVIKHLLEEIERLKEEIKELKNKVG